MVNRIDHRRSMLWKRILSHLFHVSMTMFYSVVGHQYLLELLVHLFLYLFILACFHRVSIYV